MTNINNRWVVMKDGEPYAVNLSEIEAYILLERCTSKDDISEYELFYDDYFEFENE